MEYKEIRFRMPLSLFKRYKCVCVEKNLSIPKQTLEILRKFVEVQEENIEKMKEIRKKIGI